MKKKFWIAISFCLLICLFGISASAKSYQDTVFGFDIMDSADDVPLTRAQAADIMVRLNGLEASGTNAQNVFVDVAADSEWSASIAMAYTLGIVSGDGSGYFYPDRTVSYQEFVKMLCSVLNYEEMAMVNGGYPDGYIKMASTVGLSSAGIKDVSAITKKEAVKLVETTLSAYPISWSFGEDTQVRDELTLAEQLMEEKQITYVEDIVTETSSTSLITQEPGIIGNDIKIGDKAYTLKDGQTAYIGQMVIAYVSDDNDILYIAPKNGYNVTEQYNADDYKKHTESTVEFEDENNQTKRARIDDGAVYVYNGRLSDGFEVIYNGTYTFIDNDRDSKAEVVFINNFESFVVEKINNASMTVTFADKRTFNGKSAFSFEEDYTTKVDIYGADGAKMDFSQIKVNMAVSIISSRDESLNTIYLSDKTVSGTVNSISAEGEITIDGNVYELSRNSDGSLAYSCSVGDSGVYVIDAFGKIAGIAGTVISDDVYGFVTRAYCDIDNDGAMSVKVITGSHRQKEVEVKQDTETISWDFINSEPIVLECTDDVRVNGSRGADDAIAEYITGSIIAYKTDETGKIKEIASYECKQSSIGYSFNAKIMSFGGFVETAQNKAFLVDEQTAVICVPQKSNASVEDFLTRVTMTDKSGGWRVCPINIDEKTKVADAVAVYADMDFSIPSAIQYDDPIYMVGKIVSVYEDGAQIYKLTLLYKDEQIEVTSRSSGTAYATISELKVGDLVRYTIDYNDQIDNIVKLGGVKGLSSYYQKDVGDGNRQVYGQAEKVTLDMLYSLTNEMVDEIVVNLGSDRDAVTYRISKEDDPPIYYYDKSEGWISTTTTDTIVSRENVGDKASEVFLYVYNTDEVQAVVIIED